MDNDTYRATQDYIAGRRNVVDTDQYQEAYNKAPVRVAYGTAAGGFFALLLMIGVGVYAAIAFIVIKVAKGIFFGLRTTWRINPLLTIVLVLTPFLIYEVTHYLNVQESEHHNVIIAQDYMSLGINVGTTPNKVLQDNLRYLDNRRFTFTFEKIDAAKLDFSKNYALQVARIVCASYRNSMYDATFNVGKFEACSDNLTIEHRIEALVVYTHEIISRSRSGVPK